MTNLKRKVQNKIVKIRDTLLFEEFLEAELNFSDVLFVSALAASFVIGTVVMFGVAVVAFLAILALFLAVVEWPGAGPALEVIAILFTSAFILAFVYLLGRVCLRKIIDMEAVVDSDESRDET